MIRQTIFCALLCIAPCCTSAQFTYLGGGTGFSLGKIANGVHYTSWDLELFAMVRPFRKIGVGFKIDQPLVQYTGFHINKLSNQSFIMEFEPNELEYTFHGEMKKSLIFRFFFGESVIGYVDARINSNSFNEGLIFARESRALYGDVPDLPAVDINQRITYNAIYPGFYLGIMPHLSEHIFLDWNIGIDLMRAHVIKMNHSVAYWRTNELQYAVLSNPFDGSFTIFSISLGIGYFF